MKGYGIVDNHVGGWIEKERPACGPLDAILRPVLVAPCTSDVHNLHGGSTADRRGRILGHEAIGEVVEVGSLVKRVKPGDIVAVPASTPDWGSRGSQEGFASHDHGLMSGFKLLSQKDGTMAEFFHVNEADANLAFIPEGVSREAALMTVDMMTTGFYAVERADVQFGDQVAVIGIGPVGLMAVAAAQLRGAGRIIAVGTRPNCVKIAKEYGASNIVSYKEGDIVAQVKELTGGGADRVIIAGGKQETFKQAVQMTRATGTVANVNFFDVTDTLSMSAPDWGLGMGDVSIKACFALGGRVRIERLMALIKHGRVDPTKLITHSYKGFDKMEDAMKIMDEKPQDLIKPVVYIDW